MIKPMIKPMVMTSLSMALVAGINTSASAALASDAVLNFNPGVTTTSSSSGTVFVKSGSYFGIDSDSNGKISTFERTAIRQNDGLLVGQSQFATGSHSGVVNGSESPGIDKAWELFTNTGMHWTQSPVNIINDDGAGNVELDLSGWTIAWSGLQNISLGSGAWQTGFIDGVAQITCAADCRNGDSYTLDYSATFSNSCACGFENAPYTLHLEGTISSVPIPAAVWLFGSGLLGLAGVARRRKT
ncbi:hypothetical protein MNBD_GAMMA09-1861 [hydrothermal vent metagenome]|uniref:PEP-CTERM protein-sorting domain-containing protein n=1 Tax=hydrothermal vent metagenome TaxID=652676 RepID=A0A3B0YK65_9ZZZZ